MGSETLNGSLVGIVLLGLVLVALVTILVIRTVRGHLGWLWRNRHGLLRVIWRLAIFSILVGAAGLLVNLIAGAIVAVLGVDRSAGAGRGSVPIMILGYALIIAGLFAASAAMVRRFDRRSIASLGLGLHSHWLRELSIGLFLGAFFVSAIVTVQLATGTLELEASGLAVGFLAQKTVLHVLFFTGVAFFEELLFRGYLLQILAEGFGDFAGYVGQSGRLGAVSRDAADTLGKVAAAILLSAPFGVLHYFNTGGTLIGAISAGTAGLVLCLAYFRTRSLWIPVGMHTTWNLFIAWVFSLPVSGETFPDAPLIATPSGPEWLSGGTFGPEGSILAFLALGCMAVVLAGWRHAGPSAEAAAWYTAPGARMAPEVKPQAIPIQ